MVKKCRRNQSVPSTRVKQSKKNDCLTLKIWSDRFYRNVPEDKRSLSSETQVLFLLSEKGVLGTEYLAVLMRPSAGLKVLDSGYEVDVLLLPVSEPQSLHSASCTDRAMPAAIGMTGK
jgi:hypothetical protein